MAAVNRCFHGAEAVRPPTTTGHEAEYPVTTSFWTNTSTLAWLGSTLFALGPSAKTQTLPVKLSPLLTFGTVQDTV